MMLPCNQTTCVTAAVLQIASAGGSRHIPTGIKLPDIKNPAVIHQECVNC